ncbi:MAG: hypothetical protein MUF53_08325 [Gemmatimonadaceae bacterium]|nr:hypothetical protein [Gemmatimonadaceae bacterium]
MTQPGPVPFVPRSRPKAAAGRWADAVLTWLAPWLVAPRRPLPRRPRVLVMRPDHLGDAVMATAALAPLAEALEPEALDVLCGPWAADVFARLPEVTRVLPVALPWWMAARGAPWLARVAAWGRLPGVVRRLRANRYDVVIDLRGDLRHLLVAALTGASERVSTDRTGGVALCTRIWPFDQRPHEVEKTMSILATLGVRRIVRPKMVPPSGLPAALLDRLPPGVT